MAEKEYIEREAAINEQKRFCGYLDDDMLCRLEIATRRIPAAAVRPVVLCRDCKWTKLDGMDDPAIYCKKWDRWEMPLDGFCWLGKKREES